MARPHRARIRETASRAKWRGDIDAPFLAWLGPPAEGGRGGDPFIPLALVQAHGAACGHAGGAYIHRRGVVWRIGSLRWTYVGR